MAQFGKHELDNEDVEVVLRDAAELITKRLGKKWGFTILGFEFGEDGSMFYISNGSREDVIKSMREFIDKNDPTHTTKEG